MQRRSSMNKRANSLLASSSISMDRKQLNNTKRVGSINRLINVNDDYISYKKPLQFIEAVKTVRINPKVNINNENIGNIVNNNNNNNQTTNNTNNQLNSTTKHLHNNNNPTLSSPTKSKPLSKLTSIPLSIANA